MSVFSGFSEAQLTAVSSLDLSGHISNVCFLTSLTCISQSADSAFYSINPAELDD